MHNYLSIALILFLIFAGILIYKNVDFSRDAIVNRRKKMASFLASLKTKIIVPCEDKFYSKVSDEKRKKKEAVFQNAGIKINFAQNIAICAVSSLALSLGALFGLKNPYLAISAFGLGWNIPGFIGKFVANKRIEKINNQIGMFMRMVIKRYQVLEDFYLAFGTTIEDFTGEEPLYSELVMTMNNINRGDAIDDALHDLAKRTDNKFLKRFADYYAISAEIGTKEARQNILNQALKQYEEHMFLGAELKKQMSELTMEAYIMLLFVPAVFVYQSRTDPTYIPFMTTTMMGKVGLAVILTIWLLCLWVINVKLAAPVDSEET